MERRLKNIFAQADQFNPATSLLNEDIIAIKKGDNLYCHGHNYSSVI